MKGRFADVLRGLMDHRRPTPEAVAQATGRARSAIGITEDISPVLETPVAGLRVIAGLPDAPEPGRSAPYRAATWSRSPVTTGRPWLTDVPPHPLGSHGAASRRAEYR